jgi:hypothetical protein
MTHNVAHLMDYAQSFYLMSVAPPRVEKAYLPNPTATYSMQQLMDWAPNSKTYGLQANFMLAFIGARTMNQFVPSVLGVRGGVPLWAADLPFSAATPAGRAANKALEQFRRDASAFLANFNGSRLVRPTNFNWQSPTRLPRTITL